MPNTHPPDHLDLIPEPAEIQRRLTATVRSERLLRRLLRLAVTARRQVDPESDPPRDDTGLRPEVVPLGR